MLVWVATNLPGVIQKHVQSNQKTCRYHSPSVGVYRPQRGECVPWMMPLRQQWNFTFRSHLPKRLRKRSERMGCFALFSFPFNKREKSTQHSTINVTKAQKYAEMDLKERIEDEPVNFQSADFSHKQLREDILDAGKTLDAGNKPGIDILLLNLKAGIMPFINASFSAPGATMRAIQAWILRAARSWKSREKNALAAATAAAAAEKVKEELRRKISSPFAPSYPALTSETLAPFLEEVSHGEIEDIWKMSALSALTYYIEKVDSALLTRRFGLDLVETSLTCNFTNSLILREDEQAVTKIEIPVHWFVCDDHESGTRHFVLQGSDNLESWKTNLTFDAVPFEEQAPDAHIRSDVVTVHRGFYEVAKGLYEIYVPLIETHVQECHERFQTPRISLSGHSLGGSVAVLLSMMMLVRKTIEPSWLLPIYTFGAPSALCGAETLLGRLGTVPFSHYRSIMMHRDLVPRAFACWYPGPVAGLLRSVHENFRASKCLQSNALLYAPIGQMLILQPPLSIAHEHELLPKGPGLYRITTPGSSVDQIKRLAREQANRQQSIHHEGCGSGDDDSEGCILFDDEHGGISLSPPQTIVGPAINSSPGCGCGGQCSSQGYAVVLAERAFMNSPHPLDILSDPGAYGPDGSVSRHHNPDNYTRALDRLKKLNTRRSYKIRPSSMKREKSSTTMRNGSPLHALLRKDVLARYESENGKFVGPARPPRWGKGTAIHSIKRKRKLKADCHGILSFPLLHKREGGSPGQDEDGSRGIGEEAKALVNEADFLQ